MLATPLHLNVLRVNIIVFFFWGYATPDLEDELPDGYVACGCGAFVKKKHFARHQRKCQNLMPIPQYCPHCKKKLYKDDDTFVFNKHFLKKNCPVLNINWLRKQRDDANQYNLLIKRIEEDKQMLQHKWRFIAGCVVTAAWLSWLFYY